MTPLFLFFWSKALYHIRVIYFFVFCQQSFIPQQIGSIIPIYPYFGGRKMLVFDLYTIGAKLYEIRRRKGLTQAEVAEKAELSDRTYADIERGHVNMRVETLLKICSALNITPNSILVVEEDINLSEQNLIDILSLSHSS